MIDELLANYAYAGTTPAMRRFGAAGHADAITALVAQHGVPEDGILIDPLTGAPFV